MCTNKKKAKTHTHTRTLKSTNEWDKGGALLHALASLSVCLSVCAHTLFARPSLSTCTHTRLILFRTGTLGTCESLSVFSRGYSLLCCRMRACVRAHKKERVKKKKVRGKGNGKAGGRQQIRQEGVYTSKDSDYKQETTANKKSSSGSYCGATQREIGRVVRKGGREAEEGERSLQETKGKRERVCAQIPVNATLGKRGRKKSRIRQKRA